MQKMAKSVTQGAISSLLSNPSPDSFNETQDIVVQVVDLKPIGNSTTRFTFFASDGQRKLKAMLPTYFSSEIHAGKFQNLGLIRILDYTCNAIPNQSEKALIITKCEVVSPALETEIASEVKNEPGIISKPKQEVFAKSAAQIVHEVKNEPGIILKPKQEVFAKSAAQIVHEQHGNSAPAARMALTRRVHPLVSLNPYQGSWTIKVCLTNKGNLRTYKNAKGEGHVFNVELTDEDGTQIQATMFNKAASKFYPKFELGKMYYISNGTLRVANKQFKTVHNDYEMNLNENSEVEEVVGEGTFVPETKFNFIQIEDLGSYVNGRELVDIIGVLQNVSPTTSIRRKINNETIPKRDITVADDSRKTVVVSLWNDLATTVGQGLLDMVESAPIVAIKSLKVGDFQGVSLSTLSRSTVQINPEIPETKRLRSWYESEGKGTLMAAVGSGMNSVTKSGARSFYSDRVSISHITSNSSLGQEKPAFFSLKGYVSFIKPDQTMWYRACKLCNKKVTEALGSGYWCEGCQKNDAESNLRYILVVKISDPTGEAWVSVFNEQAEKIIGCTADELERIKSEAGDGKLFQQKLKEAKWVPHLFRVSVVQHEYNNEKRQRITLRAIGPLDWSAESRYLLEEISKVTIS